MSNPVHTMETRVKNATQHPGYVQQKPHQPADSNAMMVKLKKTEATAAAKAAKVVVKKVNNI